MPSATSAIVATSPRVAVGVVGGEAVGGAAAGLTGGSTGNNLQGCPCRTGMETAVTASNIITETSGWSFPPRRCAVAFLVIRNVREVETHNFRPH